MKKMNELSDNELNNVIGGCIDYNPDSAGSQSGRIGINGNYTHRYNSEAAVLNYASAHIHDREWTSIAERDNYLFQGMIDAGIIF